MKIGENHSYTIIYNNCYQDKDDYLSIEVTATTGVFPTIYKTVEKESKLIVEEAILMKRTSEVDILKNAMSSFDELIDEYVDS